jgi:hypothetical protein
MPVKKANTGIDAEGTYKHFIKGDIISNIDLTRPQKPIHQMIQNMSQNEFSPSTPLATNFSRMQSQTPDKFSMT